MQHLFAVILPSTGLWQLQLRAGSADIALLLWWVGGWVGGSDGAHALSQAPHGSSLGGGLCSSDPPPDPETAFSCQLAPQAFDAGHYYSHFTEELLRLRAQS